MIRLLGVLVGSALAVVALVVFVGIPEFTTESDVAESTVITLPIRAGLPAAETETQAPVQEPPPAAPGIGAAQPAGAPSMAETPAARTVPEARWHAFWSPFRSEVAAHGFIDQLQRMTGLDYRVVKLKPGVYEVAFAYEDEQDISAKLSQISAATGLQLPEG
jgi:hypothetical protein